MRQIVFVFSLLTLSVIGCKAQKKNNMEKEIRLTIESLEQAAFSRNISLLDELLDDNYRVVANRFRGTLNSTVLTKDSYLSMMKAEKIGGSNYQININAIRITDHTAMVDVDYLTENSGGMHKYLILIQDDQDKWKVVSDIPVELQSDKF